ncbi:hypothetical protein L1887_56504 [Cichorium endivia]|nr:hypothetical protein L1887_56504 [Cichorium endivia]
MTVQSPLPGPCGSRRRSSAICPTSESATTRAARTTPRCSRVCRQCVRHTGKVEMKRPNKALRRQDLTPPPPPPPPLLLLLLPPTSSTTDHSHCNIHTLHTNSILLDLIDNFEHSDSSSNIRQTYYRSSTRATRTRPRSFRWRHAGGKLPGLYGGDEGCGGGNSAQSCWSTRMAWRTNGTGELYVLPPAGQAEHHRPPPSAPPTATSIPTTECKSPIPPSSDKAGFRSSHSYHALVHSQGKRCSMLAADGQISRRPSRSRPTTRTRTASLTLQSTVCEPSTFDRSISPPESKASSSPPSLAVRHATGPRRATSTTYFRAFSIRINAI